jgi:hypothetical protein
MFAESLSLGYIPSDEEIFNILGSRQLPTREMEYRRVVTRLGGVSAGIAAKLALHYGSESIANQIISVSIAQTLGGWLGDNLGYQLLDIGTSIPAQAIYTRLYGEFSRSLVDMGSSAISQAFIEQFDIDSPLPQIVISEAVDALSNHIFSSLSTSIFGKEFSSNYLGVDPNINLSLNNTSIVGEVVNTGFGALQSFASSQLFKYVDNIWNGVDLQNLGSSLGGLLGGFIAPGIGSFLGSVIGGWAWDLLFDKDPNAYYSVHLSTSVPQCNYSFASSSDGGKTDVALQMAQSASETIQLVAGIIGGKPFHISTYNYGFTIVTSML